MTRVSWTLASAFFGLMIALSAPVSAQVFTCSGTELQCHNSGGATTEWSSAWQSFDSNGLTGKAVDSVVLRLRVGPTNTAEGLTVTIYADSDGTNSACTPDMISALATSAAVTVPNDNIYRNVSFSFADDVLLDPAETYYFRLEDPSPNGVDQIIVFDITDPPPIAGGSGGNCGTLNHQVNGRDVDLSTIDTDNDGVTDDLDECPNTPEGATVDAVGCADSQKDTDNDGVTDDLDECPNTPEGATVDAVGCADSQKDTDNDGVTDDLDECPNTPEGATVDAVGCADSQKDTDNDGVTDDLDECPNTPEGATVDAVGCADSQKDTDNDGVTDDLDECPNTPEGATVDAVGCADTQRDADSDGVSDALDECPNTPEGSSVDEVGCADSQRDSDSDGVTDDLDQCPGTPAGEVVDAEGCSESQRATAAAVTVPTWHLPFTLLAGVMILLVGGFRLRNWVS